VDGTIADSGWLQIVLEDGSKGYLFLKILKPAGPKATPAPVVPKSGSGQSLRWLQIRKAVYTRGSLHPNRV